MEVHFDVDESEALQAALRSFLSDLRMEISQTDNPAYRRELRADREALESVVTKLDAASAAASEHDSDGRALVRFVGVWWSPTV